MLNRIIILLCLSFSANIFACRVKGEMAASQLFQRGLTNKLVSMPLYSSYEVKKIIKIGFPNSYDVYVEDEIANKCFRLTMDSYGTGSCEFTADIVSEVSLECSNI
jgi:hypothetical protein